MDDENDMPSDTEDEEERIAYNDEDMDGDVEDSDCGLDSERQ